VSEVLRAGIISDIRSLATIMVNFYPK